MTLQVFSSVDFVLNLLSYILNSAEILKHTKLRRCSTSHYWQLFPWTTSSFGLSQNTLKSCSVCMCVSPSLAALGHDLWCSCPYLCLCVLQQQMKNGDGVQGLTRLFWETLQSCNMCSDLQGQKVFERTERTLQDWYSWFWSFLAFNAEQDNFWKLSVISV